MKVALSHDWLNGMRGGEKCLEVLCELYPKSPIYTLFYEKGKVSDPLARHTIITSRIQNFPKVFTHYRFYLPFFPTAIEAFRLQDYDLVISTSHCVAKGIKKNSDAIHVCYCFTPARYAWGFFEEYFGGKNFLTKGAIQFFMQRLKAWDLKANEGVDHFIAISRHVKNRIQQYYQRPAEVIYPPVDADFYHPDPGVERQAFYLVVSALVPYKKIDTAIEAFNRLGRRLVVIGDGPEKKRLQKMARKNIEFLGWQSNEILQEYYRRAKALIFPGEEDFGIVPVEMQASGGFVIAFRKGGALETVLDKRTGLFFDEPSGAALEEAVCRFEKSSWDPAEPRANALGFGRERFKMEIKNYLENLMRSKKSAFS